MSELLGKKEILSQSGFKYNIRREMYFNRNTKKVFSLEAIEDNTLSWLEDKINTEKFGGSWSFYFNRSPSQNIKDEIIEEIDK